MEHNNGGLEDHFLYKLIIFRFHVNLPGCSSWGLDGCTFEICICASQIGFHFVISPMLGMNMQNVRNYHPVFQFFINKVWIFLNFPNPSIPKIKWTCCTKPPLTTTSECLHSNDQTSEAESESWGNHPECKSTLSGGRGESGRNPASTSWGKGSLSHDFTGLYVFQVVQDVFHQQYLMDSCSI